MPKLTLASMYYPVGWPKLLDSQPEPIKLCVDKLKILFALLYEKSICIWFCSPSLPITHHERTEKCIQENGTNAFVEWKVDSSKLVIAVSSSIFFLLTWMFFFPSPSLSLTYASNFTVLAYALRQTMVH